MTVTPFHGRQLLLLVLGLAACGDDPKPDTAPPVIAIETPTAGANVESPVLVTGTAVDAKVKGRKTSKVATVTVDGVAATLDGDRFSASVSGLGVGEHVFTVEALDHAGNAATATVTANVDAPITGMIVQPAVAAVESATVPLELVVSGFYEGTGKKRLLDGVTFESADPSVATVDAAGFVAAAGDTIDARTEITVRYRALTTVVPVHVAIDLDPPARPEVLGYHSETNQRDQTWSVVLEPGTLMRIDNPARGGEPDEITADAGGRVWTSVPLVANRSNPITVTLTDPRGNASEPYEFPVLQSDGFVDGGSSTSPRPTTSVGFVGERLPETLAVRAFDNAGRPKARWRAVRGRSSAVRAASRRRDGAEHRRARSLATRTDGDGYARATWWLGARRLRTQVEVHASLEGDVGFPGRVLRGGLRADRTDHRRHAASSTTRTGSPSSACR